MVRGNPYISTNSATMKAEKALNDRQSRAVRGFVKLKAKIMNTNELMMTSDHKPYAGASSICTSYKKLRSWLAMLLMLLIRPSVTTMPPMKQMQKRTQQQQNIRQGAKNMCFVLFPKEKESDRCKSQKHKTSSRL